MGIFDLAPPTIEGFLGDLEKRVTKVEQHASGVPPQENVFSEGIWIGDQHVDNISPDAPVGPASNPTHLTITPGIYRGEPYVDIEWAHSSSNDRALGFDVEITRKISIDPAPVVWDIPDIYKTFGETIRITGLVAGAHYGARVRAYSMFGELTVPFPATGWEEWNQSVDTTIPTAITGVTVGRGATQAVVSFDPSTDFDVADGQGLYKVQVDTVNTFNSVNFKELVSSSFVVAITINGQAAYYARVAAIDYSGNQGPWSTIAGPATVGGVIDSMVVAGLNAAKITFGTMSGDRITANTLDADTIKTSDLTAALITLNGGQIKAGTPGTTGMRLSATGLRFWQAGLITADLDATTGDVTFNNATLNGTFQTNTSGKRIVIKEDITSDTRYMEYWPPVPCTTPARMFEGDYGTTVYQRYYVMEGTNWPLASQPPRITMDSDGRSGSPSFRSKLTMFAYDWVVSETINTEINQNGSVIRLNAGSGSGLNSIWVGDGTNIALISRGGAGRIFLTGNIEHTGDQYTSGNSIVHLDLTVDRDFSSRDMIAGREIYSGANMTCAEDFYVGQTSLFIGQVNLQSVPAGSGVTLVQTGTGVIGYDVSSKKFKENIQSLDKDNSTPDHSLVGAFKPVSFNLISEPDRRVVGFLAEDLADLHSDLVHYNSEGEVMSIDWNQVTTLLISEVQNLRSEVDLLKKG